MHDLSVRLDIGLGRAHAGAKTMLYSSLRRVRFLPENLNLTAVILPLVKTKPAQQWLTQTNPPLVNSLLAQRYKKFPICLFVVCFCKHVIFVLRLFNILAHFVCFFFVRLICDLLVRRCLGLGTKLYPNQPSLTGVRVKLRPQFSYV
jgi:hypothetical protein